MAGKAHDIGDRNEPEQRLRLLVQSIMTTTDCVSITDVDDKILFVNKSFTDTYGYTEEELLGKNIAIVRSPLMDPDIGAQIARETLKSGWNGEVLNRHKDGTDFSLELWTSAVRDEGGIPYALVGVARDLSDRKKAEAEIRRSNTKYQMLFENANDPIIIFRPGDEKILEVNRKACEVYGYTREEFTSLNLHSITLDPDYGEMIVRTIIREEKDGHLSSVHYGKDGNAIHVHSYVYVIDYTGDQAIVSINRDITSRIQTEARLRENEERLRLISENVTDYLALLDAKGIYHYVTDSYRLLGYDPSAVLGTSIFSYVHPDDKARFANEMQIVTDTYSSRSFEFRFKRNTGGWMTSEIVINVMVGDSGSELVIAMRDITERVRREEELQKFSMAIKQSPVSIMITDVRGTIEYVNPKFTEMTGYSANDVVGQSSRMLQTEETLDEKYDEFLKTIQAEKEWRGEFHSRRKNGEMFWAKTLISPIKNAQGVITHILSITEDVTERQKMLEELRKSEVKLRLIMDNAFDGISIYEESVADKKRHLVECNRRYAEMAGRTREELLRIGDTIPMQRSLSGIQNPSLWDITGNSASGTLRVGKNYQGVFSWIRPDGKENIIEYNAVPINIDGKIFTIGLDRDVTDRIRAEQKLRS